MNFSPTVLLILSLCSASIKADIQIDLFNNSAPSTRFPFWQYRATEWFTYMHANTNSTMVGYLHQPEEARNGCLPVTPVPTDGNLTHWIAVIEDYPSCVDEMMKHIMMAGYSLIIAYSPNNKNNSLPSYVKNYSFPIVVISEEYGNYLVANALSDFDDPEIEAFVQTDAETLLSISLFVSGGVLFAIFFICCACCLRCYVNSRRNRYDRLALLQRRRNFDRLHSRDRIARQELIESILRQLQQLQIDVTAQMPLGAEQTRRLPTQEYSAMSESQEVCAICVDEFNQGDVQRVLPCRHSFHLQCIDEWLINHSDLCPLCKKQVPKDTPGNPVQAARGGGLIPVTDDETDHSDSASSQDRLLSGPNAARRYGSVIESV